METLWSITDIGKHLGVSRFRANQLKLDGKLPEPDFCQGRQVLWRPETITGMQREGERDE